MGNIEVKEVGRFDTDYQRSVTYRVKIREKTFQCILDVHDFTKDELESAFSEALDMYRTVMADYEKISDEICGEFYPLYRDNWAESLPIDDQTFKSQIELTTILIDFELNPEVVFDVGDCFDGHGIKMSVIADEITYKLQ